MSEKHIYKKYALHNFKKKNEEEKLNAVLLSLQIQICGEEKTMLSIQRQQKISDQRVHAYHSSSNYHLPLFES